MRRIVPTLAVLAFLAGCGAPAPPATPDDQGDRAAGVADLAYLLTELEARHPDIHARIIPPALDAAAADVRERLPGMSDVGRALALKQLVARIGDPHTDLDLTALAPTLRRYPARFDLYEDGLFLLQTDRDRPELPGARVLSIGGRSVEQVLARLRSLQPTANDYFWRHVIPNYIQPDVLDFVGIPADSLALELEWPDGERATRHLPALPPGEEVDWTGSLDLLEGRPPIHLARTRQHYWGTYLENVRTAYIQFNRLVEQEDLASGTFIRETLRAIDEQPVEAVVIDLRHNTGGNSLLMRPLIEGLRERSDAGFDLYVVTGWSTFSSAVINALELREIGATLVGQPTGGRPNHFGEVRSFHLPRSGLRVRHSTRYFELIPGSDPPTLEPDVRAPDTFAAVVAGRDPALEAILVRYR